MYEVLVSVCPEEYSHIKEPRISLSSVVRSAPGTMPNEGIQGHEWGAYVVLDTFLSDGTWDGLRGASLKGTECQ